MNTSQKIIIIASFVLAGNMGFAKTNLCELNTVDFMFDSLSYDYMDRKGDLDFFNKTRTMVDSRLKQLGYSYKHFQEPGTQISPTGTHLRVGTMIDDSLVNEYMSSENEEMEIPQIEYEQYDTELDPIDSIAVGLHHLYDFIKYTPNGAHVDRDILFSKDESFSQMTYAELIDYVEQMDEPDFVQSIEARKQDIKRLHWFLENLIPCK
ncbi:MAG: hypothetical protein N4A33_03960 [Bacteriovoracaceae bacterium]|jgi:hypothetical protein|nr:hypothetical protein [Bacteriovoracaceae bacterium]